MIRIFAAAFIAVLTLSGGAFAADAPKAEAPKAGAPAASSGEWFPHFMEACKQHGLEEADCKKRYEERKTAVLNICKKEGITGPEENCRQWMVKRIEEQRAQRLAVCKENGIEGEDACAQWIARKQAEAMDAFQEQCRKDGLNEDQCQQRYNETVRKWQAENKKFIEDCEAKGGSKSDCLVELRKMRQSQAARERAGGAANNPTAEKPGAKAGSDKGTALPPPK